MFPYYGSVRKWLPYSIWIQPLCLCALQLTGERDRTQQGRLLPGAAPDARNNQDRRAKLAALGIVLPAGAPAADETAGQESRKRKDRSVGHAGTVPGNRGVCTRTRTRYHRRHGYAD